VTALAVVAAIVAIGLVVAGGGSDDDDAGPSEVVGAAAPGEIFLQPVSEPGPDPFTPSAAAPAPRSTIPASTPITLAPRDATGSAPTAPVFTTVPATTGPTSGSPGPIAVAAMPGATPGLYGGTRDQSRGDQKQKIEYLDANPDKAAAWAAVQGIGVDQLASYLEGLTPVVLRSDTRVTNHGFRNGRATPLQSILQAGTAVLVDEFGTPRARCACGNPLLPPRPIPSAPTYKGSPWPGFSPANVTVINASTTVINIITIIDIRTGEPFGRPTGPQPGPDQPLPGATAPGATAPAGTGTTPTPTGAPPATLPAATAPPTTAGATGPLLLVDVVPEGPRPDQGTIDARAGRMTLTGPGYSEDYQWTVPPQIDPAGTRIDYGGTPTGNANIEIGVRGEGLAFDTTDADRMISSRAPITRSTVMTVPTPVREAKLILDLGFTARVTYVYRR
jgi:hypothetical protein